NMVTLFALIVTLGIVVDDAIIVAENVHDKRMQGMGPMQAAIVGARQMAVPVVFSVLTTCTAFAPLLLVPGTMGKIMGLIPVVVMAVLLLSLLESFFILPAHLAHVGERRPRPRALRAIAAGFNWLMGPVDALRARVSRGLSWFTERVYRPFLDVLLVWRYSVVATGVASLIVCISLVKSGVVPFSFFPALEGDIVSASVRMPYGTPV